MKRKNCILATMVAVILFVSFLNTFAHPGRTDSNGGHWNRATGEYHFHTGEYAGKSHSSSSSSKSSGNFKEPYEPPTDNPYKNDEDDEDDEYTDKEDKSISWVTIIILFIFLVIPMLMSIVVPLICICYEYSPCNRISKLNDALDEYEKHFERLLELDSKDNSTKASDLYEIGNDGLPKDKDADSDWGKTFTLYRTAHGAKLHAKYNCCSAKNPLHIYYYRNCQHSLCQRCSSMYNVPDMSWYEVYLQKKTIQNDLKQLMRKILKLHKQCNSMLILANKTKLALEEVNQRYFEIRYKK